MSGVRHFLAPHDLETGRLFGQFTLHKTWMEWLSFLKVSRRRYRRTETRHIVLDNYKPHLAGKVLRWATSHGIKFYLIPTNASWLNPIGCQFTALKKFALDNSDYQTHEEQQEGIGSHLASRNGRREIAIESWKTHIHKTRGRKDAPVPQATAA